MDFLSALSIVETHGLEMLDAANGNLMAVAVGARGGGPIEGADDFAVAAFVLERLSSRALVRAQVEAFNSVFSAVVGPASPTRVDLEVVECGSEFSPMPSLVVPAVQRGLYGGTPPPLDAQKKFSSLRMGIGITNPETQYPGALSVGTAGFYVRDDQDRRYVVSNNHVIGHSNGAVSPQGIVQPGTLDLDATELATMSSLPLLLANSKIAEFTSCVPLQFRTKNNIPVNRVDAALAQLLTDSGRGMSELDRLSYGGSLRGVAAPYQLDPTGALVGSARVYKVGRTTGYTEGVVTHLAGVATIPYPPTGHAHFTGQIVIKSTWDNGGPFSKPGDSGSAVLNDEHEIVGLLFAGSSLQTLVNPIDVVLAELQAVCAPLGINGLDVIHV